MSDSRRSGPVWLIKPDGESLRKVMDGGYPHWSGDGETVFMHSRREKKVFASDVDDLDGKPEEFFAEPQSIYPAVSPDGQRIAFGDSGFLIISDRETGETVLTWAAPGSRGLLPAWSPDGKHVAFGGFDNDLFGLWILDVNMEKAVQVARGRYTMPAWSKDGKKIAFDVRSGSTREIWSVDVNTILELHGETNETNDQQVP